MAFSIFPEEIWKLIVEKMDTVQDISNLFEAYPEMTEASGVFKTKRANWFSVQAFYQLYPHIFPWLSKEEVLRCREVCNRWSQGVDHFLENHPSRRPYDPEVQPLLPSIKIHSTYYQPSWKDPTRPPDDLNIGGGVIFEDYWKVRKFLSEILVFDRPLVRNPFIGRLVKISEILRETRREQFQGRWLSRTSRGFREIMRLLEQYGAHIWFLEITKIFHRLFHDYHPGIGFIRSRYLQTAANLEEIQREYSDFVLDSLNHVPSLKSLTLKLFLDSFLHPGERKQLELKPWRNIALPALPHLETLEVFSYDLPEILVHALLMNYSSQLRRLSMDGTFWREEYSKLFPRLTEFNLLEESRNSEEKISNILMTLDAPQLHKLHLKLSIQNFILEDEIIPWLKQFPKLEFLTMDTSSCGNPNRNKEDDAIFSLKPFWVNSGVDGNELGGEGLFEDAVPSLKHLCMNNYTGRNEEVLDFLLSFPSLETLTIYPKLRFSGCFKHENMYEPLFWDMLPKLKKIDILCFKDLPSPCSHYFRANYDFLNKKNVLAGEGNFEKEIAI